MTGFAGYIWECYARFRELWIVKKSFMRSRCITDLFSSLILSHSFTYLLFLSLSPRRNFFTAVVFVVIVVSGQVYYLVEISSETFNEWMRGKIWELHAQYSPLFKHRRILKSAAAGSAYDFQQQQLATIVRVRAKDFFFFTKALDFQLTIRVFSVLPSKLFRVFFLLLREC